MATGVTVRVVSNRLPAVAAAIKPAVANAVTTTAFAIQADAQAKAPVRTGTLRRSIHTLIENGGLSARVGPSVDYAIYVEMGARGRGPRPFMRPAAEAAASKFAAAVQAALAGLR